MKFKRKNQGIITETKCQSLKTGNISEPLMSWEGEGRKDKRGWNHYFQKLRRNSTTHSKEFMKKTYVFLIIYIQYTNSWINMLSRNNYFEKTLKSPPTVSNSESVIPPKEISNSFPENSTNCLRNSQFHTIFSKNREDCFLTYFIKPSIILSKTVKKENY